MLSSLINEELSAVEFVERYLQLRFADASLLTLYAWPHVADGSGVTVAFGEPGYRDALCSVIGESVRAADVEEGSALTIEFDNDTVFALSLREEDLDTPEAGTYTSADGETYEF